MCQPISSVSLEEIHQGSFVVCSSAVVFFAPTSDIFKLPLNPRAQVNYLSQMSAVKSSPPHIMKPQPRRIHVTVHQPWTMTVNRNYTVCSDNAFELELGTLLSNIHEYDCTLLLLVSGDLSLRCLRCRKSVWWRHFHVTLENENVLYRHKGDDFWKRLFIFKSFLAIWL